MKERGQSLLRGRQGEPFEMMMMIMMIMMIIIKTIMIRLTAIREALRQPRVQREITVKTAAGKEFK